MVFAQKHPKECFAEDFIHNGMAQNGNEERGGGTCGEDCDDCIPLSHLDSLEWIVGVISLCHRTRERRLLQRHYYQETAIIEPSQTVLGLILNKFMD